MIIGGRAATRAMLASLHRRAPGRGAWLFDEYQPASEDSEFWIAPESVPECVEIRNGFELLVSIERESDLGRQSGQSGASGPDRFPTGQTI